ncbi:DUF4123 domain-containing protein [Pseudomonas sp. GD04087]|uniref:DUF4123 domain-containing protein n=1 Tax=unclassified Pseudomonas TaxID=196821 RepID=UPI00244AC1F7|nr:MULTISPECIES: DUF4123 domain-containing protein [unclassified Pseudomonas]MDH0292893.1 DUF4123 domain-containing protein [Pseudomonas sp. GD04087]MDH1050031.1 DUF4123 domain-containing protein [Pseudomonas sp. GD03903]MDH2001879.1 DUF4123 domain-containing protein [Pseudomonas sp. GD03691]
MSSTFITQWIDLLDAACGEVPTAYLDLIIDQAAGERPLIPSVKAVHPPLPWRSLFTGLPEESAEDLAPLLVRIDLHHPTQRNWLQGLLKAVAGKPQVVALASTWPFDTLAAYLGRCLEARNGGQLGLLRYYDPRLFALLIEDVLQPEQQRQLLRPAMFWSWADHDGLPRRLLGHGAPAHSSAQFQRIELSDLQVDTLMCASDATCALATLPPEAKAGRSAEQCFQLAYAAMREASAAGLIDDRQRLALLRQRLAQV